jgi:hypothetical protein
MIFLILFLIVISLIAALAEIQIERKYGWAARLPCWRIQNKWTSFILDTKPLTGYHFYMWLFLFLIFHFPLLFAPWTWALEAKIAGFFALFLVLEDFLWFVFNPAFGIKKFRKSNPELWWHKTWFWGAPIGYWPGLIIGILLLCLGHFFG